jgi:glycosyltransferase involved in cell wall biosynthesis
MALVTFIVPTVGRDTLNVSLKSILQQTNSNWECIVIFDGIPSQKIYNDPRITYLEVLKTGRRNNAGEVRNYGMQFVKTEWVAFLDDDDSISDDYVEKLILETESNPLIETFIFRMYQPHLNTPLCPPKDDMNFYKARVGISFAMKKSLIDNGYVFRPSDYEDFEMLDNLRRSNIKMMILPYVTYYVRNHVYKDTFTTFSRVPINVN